MEVAFRYLKGAEKTESELRSHLVAKGVTPGNVDRVTEYCLQKGYVDDVRVAERAVELARTRVQVGRMKVGEALTRRGVAEDTVQRVLSLYSDTQELETAAAVLKRKLGPEDKPDKAARMLATKGFSEETVWAALEKAFPGFER